MFRLYIGFCLLSLCDASSFNTSKSSAKFDDLSDMILDFQKTSPEAHAWSGGFCLASIAEAGWLRSAIINPVMSLVLQTAVIEGILPIVTASASGGSMFAIRYFTLRMYPSATKWSYPCYLLSLEFREVCYFHGEFGTISNECNSENFNTVILASNIVYSALLMAYGGPLGVAAVYISVYFPFIAGLPLKVGDMSWSAFSKQFVLWNTVLNLPSNWAAANSLVAPVEAGEPPYNYGYDSYLSRYVASYDVTGSQWKTNFFNTTATWVATASANMPTGIQLLPFALSGKSWDAASGESPITPVLKLFGTMLSFVMVKKMIGNYQIMVSTTDVSGCSDCPIGDGGLTDSVPMTSAVSTAADIAPYRPNWLISTGCQSNMVTIKYLMGAGPMGLWTGLNINMCPFTIPSICTILGKVTALARRFLPESAWMATNQLESAYSIYRPEIQLFTPYCGDPLSFDKFEGLCDAEGLCDMWITIIPSTINDIPFTPDSYSVVFVATMLTASPVSARFVNAYLPESILWIPYYENAVVWFPNFGVTAPQKGGVAFTSVAGNTLMDYMTYLGIRLVDYLLDTKMMAQEFASGIELICDYKTYEMLEALTASQSDFLKSQASLS